MTYAESPIQQTLRIDGFCCLTTNYCIGSKFSQDEMPPPTSPSSVTPRGATGDFLPQNTFPFWWIPVKFFGIGYFALNLVRNINSTVILLQKKEVPVSSIYAVFDINEVYSNVS